MCSRTERDRVGGLAEIALHEAVRERLFTDVYQSLAEHVVNRVCVVLACECEVKVIDNQRFAGYDSVGFGYWNFICMVVE